MHKPAPSAADLEKALSGVDYPKPKQELVEYAERKYFSSSQEQLLDLMRSLPNRTYRNAADVAKSLDEIKQIKQTRARTASA